MPQGIRYRLKVYPGERFGGAVGEDAVNGPYGAGQLAALFQKTVELGIAGGDRRRVGTDFLIEGHTGSLKRCAGGCEQSCWIVGRHFLLWVKVKHIRVSNY